MYVPPEYESLGNSYKVSVCHDVTGPRVNVRQMCCYSSYVRVRVIFGNTHALNCHKTRHL